MEDKKKTQPAAALNEQGGQEAAPEKKEGLSAFVPEEDGRPLTVASEEKGSIFEEQSGRQAAAPEQKGQPSTIVSEGKEEPSAAVPEGKGRQPATAPEEKKAVLSPSDKAKLAKIILLAVLERARRSGKEVKPLTDAQKEKLRDLKQKIAARPRPVKRPRLNESVYASVRKDKGVLH